MHDPRKENPYNKFYQVEYLGNVYDRHVGWINLDIHRLRELAKISLDNNTPVWFGCDVGSGRDKDTGVMDPKIYDVEKFMNASRTMTKEERLKTYSSVPSHAMVIVGYHEDEKEIKRWKIENSWGKASGTDGFLLMTDDWFTEYVFQIVINKKYLTDDELSLLVSEPTLIPPYDPLGTLAQ